MTAAFARPFRLIQRNGVALDGVQFPNGRAIVLDDPDWGLGTAARTVDLLLAHSYHGARIEWPDEARPDPDTDLRERIQSAIEGYPVALWTPENLTARVMRVVEAAAPPAPPQEVAHG
ncbi:hypothetical protein [Streptomyces bacillaris]|uniref:hypothetical protein n=1 Tax=Streptomyces bacillaris TaxID=68179 RepID=UPI003460B950